MRNRDGHSCPSPARWVNNLGLVALNTVLLRLLFPAATVGMAAYAAEQDWCLFNYLDVPAWRTVVISVITMDLAIYL